MSSKSEWQRMEKAKEAEYFAKENKEALLRLAQRRATNGGLEPEKGPRPEGETTGTDVKER